MKTKVTPYLVAFAVIAVVCAGYSIQALALRSPRLSATGLSSGSHSPALSEAKGKIASSLADNPDPPASPVKLVFIHHSTGGNWLADPNEDQPYGGLGQALMNDRYFVSATNYGWGPIWPDQGEPIGNYTDIPNWPVWFTGQYSSTILTALYTEYGKNEYAPGHEHYFGSYSRMADPAPSRENEIIVFKSCFPNSDLYGNPGDPPLSEPNDQYTVANAKAVYNDLLTYFATRQDKLFVVITAPPMAQGEYQEDPYQAPAERAANARAFNNWLVNDWLDGYPYNNVAVFDYYNVLTSNGSATRVDDPGTNEEPNDTGRTDGNHHRWSGSTVEHMRTVNNNYSAYPTDSNWDSHPTTNGHQKATAEFVPLLNVFYNRWKSGATPTPTLALTSPQAGDRWPVNSQRQIQWTTTGTVAQVNLFYSTDAFGTRHTIVTSLDNAGSYDWTTPLTPTTSAQVRVESVISPTTVYAVSGAFTLYQSGPLDNFTYLPLALRNYTQPSGTSQRIQPADLVYQGAFRLPDTVDELGWTWSGHAMAYYPDGDPGGPEDGYPGSMFGTGNDQKQWVSETSIPIPVNSSTRDVNDLNTATTLQEFYNIRGTMFDHLEEFDDFPGSVPKAGLAYLPRQGQQTTGKLYFCWGYHLQEVPQNSEESLHGQPEVSHGWSELDLSDPQSAGAWTIGDYINFVTNDYLFPIDPTWAATNTPGKLLATGRFRDGGQGSRGPSLFAYGPWSEGNPPVPGTQLSTVPLLLYTNILATDNYTMTNYTHADEWSGGAWLTAGDKSAVIFVGTKGLGDAWYGYADGTEWPEEPPYPPIPDPPNDERGWWSDSFVGQIVFYDPADLAAVARGDAQPYEPQPYATLDIDEHLYHVTSTRQWHHVGAASFDRARGLLYVFEPLADGDKSLVHVWRLE
jgi:hypothetical protein